MVPEELLEGLVRLHWPESVPQDEYAKMLALITGAGDLLRATAPTRRRKERPAELEEERTAAPKRRGAKPDPVGRAAILERARALLTKGSLTTDELRDKLDPSRSYQWAWGIGKVLRATQTTGSDGALRWSLPGKTSGPAVNKHALRHGTDVSAQLARFLETKGPAHMKDIAQRFPGIPKSTLTKRLRGIGATAGIGGHARWSPAQKTLPAVLNGARPNE